MDNNKVADDKNAVFFSDQSKLGYYDNYIFIRLELSKVFTNCYIRNLGKYNYIK